MHAAIPCNGRSPSPHHFFGVHDHLVLSVIKNAVSPSPPLYRCGRCQKVSVNGVSILGGQPISDDFIDFRGHFQYYSLKVSGKIDKVIAYWLIAQF